MNTLDQTNIILQTDSYKLSHKDQYPTGTEQVYSYLESRQDERTTCFMGLQYKLARYLTGVQVTEQKLIEAEWVIRQHMGPDFEYTLDHWRYILETHQGKLPIRIKAVPEGSWVEGRNVLMTIENTDPNCAWLTNYIETILSHVWYSITIATNCGEMKQTLAEYAEKTCSDLNVDFSLHNFGYRGVTCEEQAAIGDLAHLLHFKGSDTLAGFIAAINYYNADPTKDLVSASVPATSNIIFGSGGGLLQKDFNRDTLKFAIKCSHAIINGKQRDVQKAPITDTGKRSKAGRLKLIKLESGKYTTLTSKDPGFEQAEDQMITVFENGELTIPQNFAEMRSLADRN